MKVVYNSTKFEIFIVFFGICDKYSIDWVTKPCTISFAGTIFGCSILFQKKKKKNPNANYAWCIVLYVICMLNLVVATRLTYDKCSSVRNFFGKVQSLIMIRAWKWTAIFLEQPTILHAILLKDHVEWKISPSLVRRRMPVHYQ